MSEVTDMLLHEVTAERRTPVLDGGGQPTFDDHGNQIFQFTPDASKTPCFVQPHGARELILEGEVHLIDHDVFFEPTFAIGSMDRLDWSGKKLQIVEIVDEQDTGTTHHVRVAATLVEG